MIISNELLVSTTLMHPIDIMQPAEDEYLQDPDEENLNEIKRKTKDNIVNTNHELKHEELAWWFLFPRGKHGYNDKRDVNITALDYFSTRILGKDLRFQRNDYLFYALSQFELQKIKSAISVCGKLRQGAHNKVEDIHLLFSNMRGSAAYWKKAYTELVAQIRCLGPPHFFVTLSCNDLHWEDFREALSMVNNIDKSVIDSMDIAAVQQLIEQNPVLISRQFMKRVNALMSFLHKNDEVFGGKVVDHWWRIEFQNRGSPHLHMVLWVDGIPSFDTPEGISKIDDVISCALPTEDIELLNLVSTLQRHSHTSTCKKDSDRICRFSFPRMPSTETKIVSHTSDDFIKNGGRICILKRRKLY